MPPGTCGSSMPRAAAEQRDELRLSRLDAADAAPGRRGQPARRKPSPMAAHRGGAGRKRARVGAAVGGHPQPAAAACRPARPGHVFAPVAIETSRSALLGAGVKSRCFRRYHGSGSARSGRAASLLHCHFRRGRARRRHSECVRRGAAFDEARSLLTVAGCEHLIRSIDAAHDEREHRPARRAASSHAHAGRMRVLDAARGDEPTLPGATLRTSGRGRATELGALAL